MLNSTSIDCLVADLSGRELSSGIARPKDWYQLLITPKFTDGDLSRHISSATQHDALRLCNQVPEMIERVLDEIELGFAELKGNLEDYQARRIGVGQLKADQITNRTYSEVNLTLQQVRGLGRELALAGLPEAWLQVSEIIHGVSNIVSARLGWMKQAQEAQLYPAEDETGALLPLDFEDIIHHLNLQPPLSEKKKDLDTQCQRLRVAAQAPFAVARQVPAYGGALELTTSGPDVANLQNPTSYRRPVSLYDLGDLAYTEAMHISRIRSPRDIAFTNLTASREGGAAPQNFPLLPYSLGVACEVVATELLRNALQALDKEGRPGTIQFRGKYTPGQEIALTVLDDGPGITPATVKSLARGRQEMDDLLKSGQGFRIIMEALAVAGGTLSVFPAHRNGHGAGFKATIPFPE